MEYPVGTAVEVLGLLEEGFPFSHTTANVLGVDLDLGTTVVEYHDVSTAKSQPCLSRPSLGCFPP